MAYLTGDYWRDLFMMQAEAYSNSTIDWHGADVDWSTIWNQIGEISKEIKIINEKSKDIDPAELLDFLNG